MFTACVGPVLDVEYVQFRIICSVLCRINVDTFEIDPHSIQHGKRLVKSNFRDFYDFIYFP